MLISQSIMFYKSWFTTQVRFYLYLYFLSLTFPHMSRYLCQQMRYLHFRRKNMENVCELATFLRFLTVCCARLI